MVSIDDWPSYSLCSPFASGFGSRAEAGKIEAGYGAIDVHRFLGAGKWFSHVFSTVCYFRIFQDCWYLSCISRFGHQDGPRNLKVFCAVLDGQPRTTHWLKMDIRSVRRHGVESMLSPNLWSLFLVFSTVQFMTFMYHYVSFLSCPTSTSQ